jgi:hypothetical protein
MKTILKIQVTYHSSSARTHTHTHTHTHTVTSLYVIICNKANLDTQVSDAMLSVYELSYFILTAQRGRKGEYDVGK